jgi:hypothetical protein
MNPLEFLFGKGKPAPRGGIARQGPVVDVRATRVPASPRPGFGLGSLLANPLTAMAGIYTTPEANRVLSSERQKTLNMINSNLLGGVPSQGSFTQHGQTLYKDNQGRVFPDYATANQARLRREGANVTVNGVDLYKTNEGKFYPNYAAAVAARGGGAGTATAAPTPSSTGTFASLASPSDRAYAQEVSRTAQLTAQNPEMQRYEAARQADLKSGDFSKSEDIGMEMWARANPTLAAKVKPGQAGYDTIQRVRQEAAQPGVGAFAATTPIFPGAQNYFSGQYQATPGATTPDLGAFTTQQNIPFAPQSIGQFPFQPPMQAPAPTQGFGAAPGIDSLGAFTRDQLSQELLKKFAGLQK